MRIVYSCLFIVGLVCSAIAQQPEFMQKELDAYVKRHMEHWQIPGMAVAVVKDGKVVLAKGFGVKEYGKTEAVDEHTQFMIASNTKAFTGTSLALLAHEGKCTLNDKVKKWYPELSMYDAALTEQLTLTDIVSHRMGFETFQGDFMYWASDLDQAGVLERFGKLKPLYDFRTKWGYTNAGYVVAGKCMEQITGKTWDAFIQERFLDPLDMKNTQVLSKGFADLPEASGCHTVVDGKVVTIPVPNIDNLAPAASMISSVSDMTHWMLMQLDSGKYEGKQVLPLEVILDSRTPRSILGRGRHLYNNTHYSLYGLGWELQDYEGREVVSHTGGANGFVSSVSMIPEENLGIVILTNNDQNSLYAALKWEIIDAYLNLPFRDYAKVYQGYEAQRNAVKAQKDKAHAEALKAKPTPSVPLSAFVGKYEDGIYGEIEIKEENEKLVLYFEHHHNLKGHLEYLGKDEFLCTYSDPIYGVQVLPFTIGPGVVQGFKLVVGDFVEFTTYDFEKK